MKRSLFLLASLVFTSALYAQAGASFTREQLLDIFEHYNPSVLEKAAQEPDYQQVLEAFLDSFQNAPAAQDRWDVIAAARNFDNSLRLHALTELYGEKITWARLSGVDDNGFRTIYHDDLKQVMADIWAVSLQTQQARLAQLQSELKTLRRSSADSATQQAALKAQIDAAKAEIRSLQQDPGALIVSQADNYQAQTDAQLAQALAQQLRAAAQETAAAQASDLQIKTNHKKPVAE